MEVSIDVSIDHFVLGVGDLNQGILEFEAKTGITPIFGGVHEVLGTHNALVSLGEGTYLELLAPLDNSGKMNNAFGNYTLSGLTPLGWVVGTTDAKAMLPLLQQHNIMNTGIRPLSRKTSEGKELKWTNIFHFTGGQLSLNPFFIDWEVGGVHPSQATPKGCRLSRFTINSVGNDGLTKLLKSLELDIRFSTKVGMESGILLELELETPKGLVKF